MIKIVLKRIINKRRKITKFAKSQGYIGTFYIGNWKEYKVYEPYMSKKEISFVGLPLVVLMNKSGEIRMSTPDEAMTIIDEISSNK